MNAIKITHVNINSYDNYYHFQVRRMFPALTRVHSQTFWNRCRFVIWLRKGAKPVHTKLNLATPRRLHGRTRRPNHDKVQVITAIKRLRRKRVAVNPQHTIVLGVTKHQTVVQ
jgi:hypothetical protein